MKPTDLIIRIPEPCHEDWNSMQPDAKGKFCSSCNKSVFDFSNKTDTEIRNVLMEYKDQNVCGRFRKSQIDRPLKLTINLNDLPKNISITKAFGIALFVVFGTLLFSCTDEKGAKIEGIELVKGIELPPPPVEVIDPVKPDTIELIEYEPMIAGGIMRGPVYEMPQPPPVPPETQVLGGMETYYVENEPKEQASKDPSQLKEQNLHDEPLSHSKIFNVYPNPNKGEFTIQYELLKRSDVRIDIFNMSGSLMKSIANVTGQYEGQYHIPVNLNDLANGIYIVSFIQGDTRKTERLVIAR